ncbi:MAG: MFS transporter [bacterium]|nr:MFS transporter [bacterium]
MSSVMGQNRKFKTFNAASSEDNACTPNSEKLPVKVKIGYAFGDFGANFLFQSVAIFLLFFWTNVFNISAETAGFIFLIAKIWDALFDPTIGYLVDKTNTRWGQKRPYLLFGAVPVGIILFLLFAAPPISSELGRAVYAAITFIGACSLYALVNVPYASMTANLTNDYKERNSLTGYRMMAAILGTLLVAVLTEPIVHAFANPVTGFRVMGMIFGTAIIVCTLIPFFAVKEKIRTSKSDHCKIKDVPKVVKSNPPMMILYLGIFFHYTSYLIFLAAVPFFFQYCLKGMNFTSIGFFCLFGGAACMLPVLVWISKKFGKKIMFNGGMTIFALGLLCLFFIHTYSLPVLIIVYIIIGLGVASIYQGPWSIVPEVIEYSEWKTGLRREGTLYGILFFFMKLAAGLGAFWVGIVLHLGGYVPNASQTATSLMTIRFVTTILPIIVFIFGAIFIYIFPITAKFHKQMLNDIESRKNNN